MSLNLSNSNRQLNPYFVELDKLQYDTLVNFNTLEGEVSYAITDIENRVINLESNGTPSVNNTHSILNYGAVGDGLTDNTQAIQDCIDANDEMIYFPNGVYLISSMIVIDLKPNMILISDGATILQDITGVYNGKYAISVTNSNSFKTQGNLIITSNSTLNITPDVDYTNIDTAKSGIYVADCNDINLNDITIKGTFFKGLVCSVLLT